MKRNVIVAQSGGPSPVINASLQGIIEACLDYPDRFKNIYAARHGVEGILLEELIDVGSQDRKEIGLLKTTPAAGVVGTCRYKLKEGQEEDFRRIIDVFRAHDVGFFFYIGGNDSMDTAHKVSELARSQDYDLTAVGVPKTIDNDLGDEDFTIIDHTPGYGSAARYWAYIIQNVNEENRGMCVSEPVSVLQAMGRTAGYIPAAARLADPEREMPLQLYLAETDHNLETLAENVNAELARSGRCIAVVSEGFNVGSLGERHDGFGHIEYGASRQTVAQTVVNYLNDHGLAVRGQATGQVPGVLQRGTSLYASGVDIEEAYQVARKAVEIAIDEGGGFMATILRKGGTMQSVAQGAEYKPVFEKVPLEKVANSVRHLPPEWISDGGLDVTDDFIHYARPLIGNGNPDIKIENGLQRFARFEMTLADKNLSDYVPVRFRETSGQDWPPVRKDT
jgi:ATP-dependent phosphofructokinase / diphosphate-dependent phosphofructokinase